MAFDAGFVAAVVHEMEQALLSSKIEKVQQPDRDAVVLQVHLDSEGGRLKSTARLLIDAGSNNPRIGFTAEVLENPKVPPMFCMLLRKHLVGARIVGVRQLGFERAVEIKLDARDEMGFAGTKYLICETMGRCSNLILLDGDYRILSALKTVDFSTSRQRQILPGLLYTLPPIPSGKVSPLGAEREEFLSALAREGADVRPDKFIMSHYLGISPLLAREIVHRAGNRGSEGLWEAFAGVYRMVEGKVFTPVLVRDRQGNPVEYSFTALTQYGEDTECQTYPDFSALTDAFFGARTRMEHIRQRSADISRILTNAQNRLKKKIDLQTADLAESAGREVDKLWGDLITANIYRLHRGMQETILENYYSEEMEPVRIPLDIRLTPAQNAQKYYKRYNKAKSAERHLTEQLAIAREELAYVKTVFDALTRAESEADLEEIRRELYESGFASRMKTMPGRKLPAPKPMEFTCDGGYRILCGKNNSQNDFITHRLAGKDDLWFHVHGMPGSHVVLLCDGEEPSAEDYTRAAIIAASCSKAPRGARVCVDYTRVRNVKKPPASKPGYVTYSTNHSAWVEADDRLIDAWRVKNR